MSGKWFPVQSVILRTKVKVLFQCGHCVSTFNIVDKAIMYIIKTHLGFNND